MTNNDKMKLKENDIIYRVITNIFGEVVIEKCKVAVADNIIITREKCIVSLLVYINGNLIVLDSTEPIFTEFGQALDFKNRLMKFRECYRELKKKEIIE